MCLIPHNLLDLQILLEIFSLKKVSKKRKVSKGPSGDRGGRPLVAYFAFFADFANEGGDFICTGFKSGRYPQATRLDKPPAAIYLLELALRRLEC